MQFAQRAFACERKLYRIALSMLNSDADAADAIQEAVFRGWLHRGALRDDAKFDAWLTRILVNECRNIQRRRKRRAEPLDEARAAALEQPPPDPALYDALMSLPERLRLPLVLHYLEGYPLRDIASIIGVTQTTVKSRLHQARGALRRALSEEGEL